MLDNSASTSSHVLIGQFKRKPPESCQKDVSKLSKLTKHFAGWSRLEVLVRCA